MSIFFELIAEIFRRMFGPIMALADYSPALAALLVGGGVLIILIIILGVYVATRN